jgi:hypothetical protein
LHKILDFYCAAHYKRIHVREPALPTVKPVWEKDSMMFKVEDIQNYGKEQYETAVASATGLQNGLSAIASAYGDYTKKSYEDTKSFVEKLSGVKSIDKALEAQTEYAKSSYETFVADAQKIAGLYGDLAKQAFKPLEGIVAKFTPGAAR